MSYLPELMIKDPKLYSKSLAMQLQSAVISTGIVFSSAAISSGLKKCSFDPLGIPAKFNARRQTNYCSHLSKPSSLEWVLWVWQKPTAGLESIFGFGSRLQSQFYSSRLEQLCRISILRSSLLFASNCTMGAKLIKRLVTL